MNNMPRNRQAIAVINTSIAAQWLLVAASLCFAGFIALTQADEQYKRQDLVNQEASVKW